MTISDDDEMIQALISLDPACSVAAMDLDQLIFELETSKHVIQLQGSDANDAQTWAEELRALRRELGK